jgi:hypothetical protein
MESTPVLRYLIFGQLRRDYLLPSNGVPQLDIPGGSLLYTGAGLGIWEKGVGLLARIGEDYPQGWLEKLDQFGFDRRGIAIQPDSIDVRYFVGYAENETPHTDNPVAHFARLGLPFPKTLLGYNPGPPQQDSRTYAARLSIRPADIPSDYFDATAAHLCPLDYLSHSLLPSLLRQGHISNITVDPSAGYMNPNFWDDIPGLFKGITALLVSEQKMTGLFQGRSTDLWAMAETIGSYGCEFVVIKRRAAGQYVYDTATHKKWIVPAYPSHCIDPTGAGDAFCGGFLAGYRATYDPFEAALYGNISASFVIEGSGPYYALDAMPGLAQARLDNLRTMARRA